LKRYPDTVAYRMFDKYKPVDLPAKSSAGFLKSRGKPDKRLPADTPVLGMVHGKTARAYSLAALKKTPLLRDKIGGQDVIVLWYGATGSAAAYLPVAAPPKKGPAARAVRLEVEKSVPGAPFRDKETGSRWDIAGRAVEGKLKGWTLTWSDGTQVKWFAWAAEYPKTSIYRK
jgi:hypothetical protein